MLEELKKQVCAANLQLAAAGPVAQTWGSVSGIDRARGIVVIKPSAVPYGGMKPNHMVAVSLETGNIVEGVLKPDSDTPTHLELYRAFKGIGGVVHTHSLFATAWAQARKNIPSYGASQADYWHGEVPCTRALTPAEIKNDYEKNTGLVIVETFKGLNPLEHPAVLVASHGPFVWGGNVDDAVHHAAILEFAARLAAETLQLNPKIQPIPPALLDQHFPGNHGSKAPYGRK
jgi:L-ribulose-5-phosphate 4-epimerase